MKAYEYHKYGPPEVLQMVTLDKPIPADDEVLIKIHATTVSAGDWRARSLEMPAGFGGVGRLVFGIFKPRNPILGMELSGEIEAVGKHVTRFKCGDQVIASGQGCYVEYKTMAENGSIVLKPKNLTYEEAAALSFGGATAVEFLRDMGHIQPGEKVLVVGASGSTGTACVQVAKYFGAEVTGVTSSANLDLVTSIGADKVIDYTKEDFWENGLRYDIIVDTVGNAPWAISKNSLTKTGRLLMVAGSLKDMVSSAFVSKKGGKKLVSGVSNAGADVLSFLVKLAAQGKFMPVIDTVYPFDELVDAHAYVDTGRKRGNVVISIVQSQALLAAAE